MGLGAASQRGLNGLVKTKSLDASIGRPDFSGSYLIKPDSVTYSGTSAYIADSGQIVFNGISSLSINGCFGPEFNNYAIIISGQSSVDGISGSIKLRSLGTDTTDSNYTRQRLEADNATVSAQRTSGYGAFYQPIVFYNGVNQTGMLMNIYGPFLSQPTSARSIAVLAYAGAYIFETVHTHSNATSYDGFTFSVSSGNVTGTLQVYGVLS